MPRLPRHIYKRGSRFYLRVTLEGREYRRSLGPRLDEARRKAALHLNALRSGKDITRESSGTVGNLGELVETWLSKVANATRSEAALNNARNRLTRFFVPTCTVVLTDLRSCHLRAVRAFAESKKLKPATVSGIMADVRCFLNWCVDAGHIPRSPWVRGLMPKLAERAPDRLTDEQVGRILEGLPEPHALLVRLALLTGIRRGELMDLHWRHFVKLPRPHLLLEGTKSGKVRRVPLSLEAETVLDRIKESTTSVCISFHRNPNAQSVVRMSGLKWHWHQLRHTFACRYLEAGGRLSALQMILGHSTSRMTERYAKLSDEAVFDDMDRIGKATSDGTNDGTPKEVISKRLAQEQ